MLSLQLVASSRSLLNVPDNVRSRCSRLGCKQRFGLVALATRDFPRAPLETLLHQVIGELLIEPHIIKITARIVP
jgi:hypothetical protein